MQGVSMSACVCELRVRVGRVVQGGACVEEWNEGGRLLYLPSAYRDAQLGPQRRRVRQSVKCPREQHREAFPGATRRDKRGSGGDCRFGRPGMDASAPNAVDHHCSAPGPTEQSKHSRSERSIGESQFIARGLLLYIVYHICPPQATANSLPFHNAAPASTQTRS
jgi:hypothetical protein